MPAGSTYTPIATTTISGTPASYTFSSIPSTYTDLVLIIAGTASGGTNTHVQFNGDTGTNYSTTYVYGDGTSAVSGRNTSTSTPSVGYISTAQGVSTVQIQNYSNATTYKSLLARWNNTGVLVAASVSLWRSTSAITSVLVGCGSGQTFTAGTTLTLYGIASA
jgi:hypothetical protein